jgi:hypothetical protein
MYFICLIGLLITSCGNEKELETELEDLSLQLSDSIVVDYLGMVKIVDYQIANRNYLALDYSDNIVMQFNTEGEIQYLFDQSGHDPSSFGHDILGLSFFNDSSVVIQSKLGYFIYTFEGELIRKIPIENKSPIYTRLKFNLEVTDKDLISLMHIETDARPNTKAYFEDIEHFTVVNYRTSHISNKIGFEPESVYLNDEFYYYYSEPTFDFNITDSLFYVIYSSDPTIYSYDVSSNYQLKKKISASPSHFNSPVKVPFLQWPNDIKSLTYDGNYQNIFSNGSFIILEYSSGISTEMDIPSSIAEMNSLRRDLNSYYLQVFKDGQKIGKDLKVPEGKFGLSFIHGDGSLILGINSYYDERNYTVFYKYNIHKNGDEL